MTSPSDHGILSPPLKKEPTESKNFPIFASISFDFRFFWFSQKKTGGLAPQGHAERRIYYPFQSLQHDPLISKSTHIYPISFILFN